ncbi:hypothetical protein FTO74_07185 [Granulicella sp. WH15]|uniref:hypothetical protein n=1 Tax=Granulicella sp. WH15 TaxID=2602070 RepID=UPI001366CDCE|nr:hypothetical protein [Granulicella sp. WH15]QHN03176.1 hypothetical protein FTO74_07185 [Granulicella sp. WH15]
MFGGLCATTNALDITANISGTMHYPQPILGASDPHTIRATQDYQGYDQAFPFGQMAMFQTGNNAYSSTAGVGNITRNASGVVSLEVGASSYMAGTDPILNNTIYISSSSTSDYNGPCTGVYVNPTAPGFILCNQAGMADSTPATAVINVGSTIQGNTQYERISTAEIVDVRDLTQPGGIVTTPPQNPPQIDGTFHLVPNPGNWKIGETATMYNHHQMRFCSFCATANINNPLTNGVNGMAVFAYQGTNVQAGWPGMTISNDGPNNMYSGYGGTLTAPIGYNIVGAHRYFLNSSTSPVPWGAVINVSCPPLGCAATNYGSYYFAKLAGSGQGYSQLWTPLSQTMVTTIGGTNVRTETPTGTSYSDPVTLPSVILIDTINHKSYSLTMVNGVLTTTQVSP